MHPKNFAVASLALISCACSYAPLAPIPEPLPEALPWSVGEERVGGAFLGVEVRENDSGSLDELFFEPGVRVTEVVANSPAEGAGLKLGDVLLSFDETKVDDPGTLDSLLRHSTGGHQTRLEVLRDDTVFELLIELASAGGAKVVSEPLYRLDPARSRAGWATGEAGVVLVSSAEDGPMQRAGFEIGTVVVAIDGEPVLSDRSLVRQFGTREPGAEVLLTVLDADGQRHDRKLRLQQQGRRLTGFAFPILFHYDADANGDSAEFVVLDLWLIWLYSHEREGNEKEWRILRWFRWSSGVGELSE